MGFLAMICSVSSNLAGFGFEIFFLMFNGGFRGLVWCFTSDGGGVWLVWCIWVIGSMVLVFQCEVWLLRRDRDEREINSFFFIVFVL